MLVLYLIGIYGSVNSNKITATKTNFIITKFIWGSMLIEDVSSNEIALEDKSKEEKPTAPPSPVNMNIINEL